MKTFLFFLFQLTVLYIFAQTAGSLDPAFGGTGYVTTTMGGFDDEIHAVAVQPDGKIVVAGYSKISSTNEFFAIARYNPNGTMDNTFGTAGKVLAAVGTSYNQAFAVTIQNDGKIIAAGYTNSNYDFALVRYNSDGSLDNTFGTGGKVITQVGSSYDMAFAVKVQNDDKILVAGWSTNGANMAFALVRYNTDGTLDNTFGTGGKVVKAIGNDDAAAYSMAIQTDGKIVLAGYSFNASNNADCAILRFNTDGTLDNLFGTGGIVTTAVGSGDDLALSVAIQTEGKIVAAGWTKIAANNNDFLLLRYDSNGALDNTFGTGGKVITPVGNSNDETNGVTIQSDGKILAAGYSSNATNKDFAVVRYNPDGTPDNIFGTGGKVTTPIGSSHEVANAIAIQPDGNIIAAGYSVIGTNYLFAVARYNWNVGVGIEETAGENDISMYPNPAGDKIYVNMPFTSENYVINIYSLTGQLLFQQSEIKGSIGIDVSRFAKGIYHLQISSKTNHINKKIIID